MVKNFIKEITLKSGETLILRQPIEEDAMNMIEYLNIVGGESDNLLFGKDEFRLSVEQEKEYIKKIHQDPNMLMLLGIINNTVVSIAEIRSLGRKRIAHNSEVAISVIKEYWGIGVGSAVMEELISFAKEHEVIKNISLSVKASNERAIKLYERFGFLQVGSHKDYFNINGEYDDDYIMDLYLDK
ncbi:MAG TPA: GNAT family N-acetyltransferase [Clostridiales bacterium]|nr:GNAT family N-acetyltransferase [Clostridiales bacterium]